MSKIVYVPGVWDLFHFGHLQYLRHAALQGDKLVVGVQSDASVEAQKGREPIIRQGSRAAIVMALGIVDNVIIYDALNHTIPFAQCGADILILSKSDNSEHGMEAEDWVEKGKRRAVRLACTPGVSTTDIRRRVIEQGSQEDGSPRLRTDQ